MTAALRLYGADEDAPRPPRAGYAILPKWISSLPEMRLSANGKSLLAAIVGLCYQDDSTIAPMAEIVAEGGLSGTKSERAVYELVNLRLIRRERDRSRPGSPWRTSLLFDRRGACPPDLEAGVTPHLWGVYSSPVGSRLPIGEDSPSSLVRKETLQQRQLEFGESSSCSIKAELRTEIERAANIFPEATAAPELVVAEAEAHGVERLRLALDLAEILGKSPKLEERPRLFRWVHGTLMAWAALPTESICQLVGLRRPKAPAAEEPPGERPAPTEPDAAAFLWESSGLRRRPRSDPGKEKTGSGAPGKSPPRPGPE